MMAVVQHRFGETDQGMRMRSAKARADVGILGGSRHELGRLLAYGGPGSFQDWLRNSKATPKRITAIPANCLRVTAWRNR